MLRSGAKWLLFCIFIGLACTKKRANEYGLDIRETLRINIITEPPTLDPNRVSDSVSSWMTLNLHEGLVSIDFSANNTKVVPALAESWEASDKNKTWTFKIRKNVKWTDGVELKAQQFVDSWERLLNPKTAADYASYLFPIKNAQSYFESKVKDFSEVGVKATDDYTLVVTLKSPMSFFPMLLRYPSTFPLRKDLVEKLGDSLFTDPLKYVSVGPFKLKTWDHDKAIVLERNDGYYGEKPKIKYVLAYMIPEASTALNLFDSGKLDYLPEFPSTEVAKQKTRPEYHKQSVLIIQYYGFNIKKKPMDNPWMRKAVVAAIDRQEVVNMLAGGQLAATSFVPQGMFGHEADRGIKFDVAKAKEYLGKAGYSETKKPARIVITINSNEDHRRVAENIQGQLKKNLGIEVEIQNEEWKVYLNKMKVDAPHIWRFAWGADYPDPDSFMNIHTSSNANNFTGWKSKSYDDLVEKAMGESDMAKRASLYSQAQKIMLEEDVVVIPLFTSVRQKLINPRVVNYPLNAADAQDYRKTSLKQ